MGIKKVIRHIVQKFGTWVNSDDVNYALDGLDYTNAQSKMTAVRKDSHSHNFDGIRGINFTVYNASGGKVIQTRTYDPRTDIGGSKLYIINDKDDLGEEIGQIITLETIAR